MKTQQLRPLSQISHVFQIRAFNRCWCCSSRHTQVELGEAGDISIWYQNDRKSDQIIRNNLIVELLSWITDKLFSLGNVRKPKCIVLSQNALKVIKTVIDLFSVDQLIYGFSTKVNKTTNVIRRSIPTLVAPLLFLVPWHNHYFCYPLVIVFLDLMVNWLVDKMSENGE